MWIPEGFAHGFFVTSKFAEVIYKATNYYDCKHEKSILLNDPDLNIKWNIFDKPILSLKDQNAHFFSELIL
jgi:dTDP-4-dehydrorhamnose 3,5-epimerase